MKKTAGFTLIELVIVIVILGILGAVAAPRFINMQGDAYEANVKALNGSIQSAMTLANTKAILGGYDREDGTQEVNGKNVEFVHGFPAASKEGIIAMLQDEDSFNTIDGKSGGDELVGEGENSTYVISDGTGNTLTIAPRARGLNKDCQVEYKQAKDENTPATVKATTSGC